MKEQRTFWGWGLVICMMCFTVTTFTLILGGADEIRLYFSGETTTGVVSEVRRHQNSKGTYRYHLKYTYKAETRELTGGSEVSESEFRNLRRGSSIRVAYLPSRPGVSSYDDVLASNVFTLTLVIGLSGFLGMVFLFFAIRGVKPTDR